MSRSGDAVDPPPRRGAERDGFLSRMAGALTDVLDPLLPRRVRCALLEFPDYGNVGDSAIWLGEKAYLQRIGARVVYSCDRHGYSAPKLAERLRDGVILLQGGGNLGDLWPAYQHFREQVIAAFPHNRVVQLPQSVWFEDKASLDRARAVFDAHPDLTLLIRDERSLEFVRREFKTPSFLCPDMSIALGPLPRARPPRQDVVWLLREDVEARDHGASLAGVESEDWCGERRSWRFRLKRFVAEELSWHPRSPGWTWPLLAPVHNRVWDSLARERLARGCEVLGRGRVVITDRLHGHLLSLLLGIPHVVLGDRHGKVRNYYETWTRTGGVAPWAQTREEAATLALRLAGTEPHRCE
jgi:pyruvyl transferase EpsO